MYCLLTSWVYLGKLTDVSRCSRPCKIEPPSLTQDLHTIREQTVDIYSFSAELTRTDEQASFQQSGLLTCSDQRCGIACGSCRRHANEAQGESHGCLLIVAGIGGVKLRACASALRRHCARGKLNASRTVETRVRDNGNPMCMSIVSKTKQKGYTQRLR